MAGIYFHVPFCKQACHYCDFHFSTNFRGVTGLVKAMKKDLMLQSNYLEGEKIETIYFGGGTPSSIPPQFIDELIQEVRNLHVVVENPEVTLEANPDDLILANIQSWKKSGVNRLSVGVQSFFDEHLNWMNRAHNRAQAISGLKLAQNEGITNITMDLIYGVPGMTMEQWKENLKIFYDLKLPHLSAYGLTVETGTHLGHQVQTNQVKPQQDEAYNEQFQYLIESSAQQGFDHYEISNFGKPNFYSRHNTSYWLGKKYLGIGPSAHSFNGAERSWTVKSNLKYVNLVGKGRVPTEVEKLSLQDQFNEYILTRLRTIWGVDKNQIKAQFGMEFQNFLKVNIRPFVLKKWVIENENSYVLSNEGKYLADKISSDLFMID